MQTPPQQQEVEHSQQADRRGVLKWFIAALSIPPAALLGWPLVTSIVGTIFRLPKTSYAKIGRLSDWPMDEPVQVRFRMPRHELYLHGEVVHEVWVVREPSKQPTVYSPICPHLGCHYNWYSSARKFICPCHGSVFALNGEVEGGPAPRPLDTLPCELRDGELYVKWERFEVGIPQRIRIG
jgi:menaquinol-cytochrome c reductase iron-sulfur subunit